MSDEKMKITLHVWRQKSASAPGSVEPARLKASAAASSASKVNTWLVFMLTSG